MIINNKKEVTVKDLNWCNKNSIPITIHLNYLTHMMEVITLNIN